MIMNFHTKYFAYDLTRRCASDSVEKPAAVLSGAQVELNPHQIEAVLFAFRTVPEPDSLGFGRDR